MIKYIGALVGISGLLVAIPQTLNFLTALIFRGWVIQFPFADDITHWGGILNGSLMIPTYKEYYELGLWGFGLILAGFLAMKYGYDLFKSKQAAGIKLIFVEILILLMLAAIIFSFGFQAKSISLYAKGILPPLAVLFILIGAKFRET